MSGITLEGKLLMLEQERAFKGEDVVRFLKHALDQIPGKKLLIVWDGSPIHRCKAVKEFLEKEVERPSVFDSNSCPVTHRNSTLRKVYVDLHRFRGLFKTENSARKGEHCHEQTRPTHRSFAAKLSGWLELPMRSTLFPGSPARSVSPMAPFGVGSTKTRSIAASEKG
jgi:hypothetical protein